MKYEFSSRMELLDLIDQSITVAAEEAKRETERIREEARVSLHKWWRARMDAPFYDKWIGKLLGNPVNPYPPTDREVADHMRLWSNQPLTDLRKLYRLKGSVSSLLVGSATVTLSDDESDLLVQYLKSDGSASNLR